MAGSSTRAISSRIPASALTIPTPNGSASGNFVRSFGEHTFNLYAASSDLSGSKLSPAYDQISWGGFLALSGYSTGQLLGENLKYGRAMYYHRLAREPHFRGRLRRFFARDRQDEPSGDCNQPRRLDPSRQRVRRRRHAARTGLSGLRAMRRTGPTASTSTWGGRSDASGFRALPWHEAGRSRPNENAICCGADFSPPCIADRVKA
jgi:hypothetical protein